MVENQVQSHADTQDDWDERQEIPDERQANG